LSFFPSFLLKDLTPNIQNLQYVYNQVFMGDLGAATPNMTPNKEVTSEVPLTATGECYL
jgi:hypothetical protein